MSQSTISTLYICATTRLAQHLRNNHSTTLTDGAPVAVTHHALTFDQWLNWLHEEMGLRGLCTVPELNCLPLQSFEERILWEQVITRHLGANASLQFDIGALAKTAMEAHTLSVVWGVPLDAGTLEETLHFAEWQQAFIEECKERNRVDAARWQQALVISFGTTAQQLHLPRQVLIAGFTRLNPIETALVQVLQQLGIYAGEYAVHLPHSTTASRSYPDAAAEVLAAALWAQQQLEQSPEGKFAIVVADLAGCRHLLQDALEDVLMPSAVFAVHAEAPRPFNISLGVALAQFPLVHGALQLLQMVGSVHRLEQATFSQLLRSPYWSDALGEGCQRALIEAELRKRLSPAAPLQKYAQTIMRLLKGKELHMTQHLHAMLQWAQQASKRQAPSVWAHVLPQLLQEVGWLFGRKLSSHEYQTQHAFFESLNAVGQFDSLLGELSLPDFAAQLRRMCYERTFQPQTEGQPRLQVLGLLEASGLNFDGVWVMGMQDNTWPPPARPNPLLPAESQRGVNAPNASAAIQLTFAQRLQSMLSASAPTVIFSWARSAGASERNPSPLIPATAPDAHLPSPPSPHWTVQAHQAGASMLDAPMADAVAPAVTDAEQVKGGTWLLRAQAICPAWGYYQYRLGAAKLEEPVEGLDSRKRGTFLHDALGYFWNHVKTSSALQALTPEQCMALVVEAVVHVLDAHDADEKNLPLNPRLKVLEQNRLVRLICGWLQLELAREHSFTVLGHELEVDVDTQGIKFTMKMDRLDQLDDGSLLVLDYKTGATIDTRNWASDRLTEPQLPIYAAVQPPTEGPVVGVVFAKVRMNDSAWAGLTQDDNILHKVNGLDSKTARKYFTEDKFPHWSSVLQHWKSAIDAIALEVKTGDAGVRFSKADDLRYCDVKPLLRLEERRMQLQTVQANTNSKAGEL